MSRSTNPARCEMWQNRLQQQKESGLSVVQFCRREGFSEASFYYWKKKFSQDGPNGKSAKTKFVAVRVNGSTSAVPKLKLPGGAVVELPSDCSRHQLAELFAGCISATKSDQRDGVVG